MTLFLQILFCLFIAVALLQVLYYLLILGKFSFTKPQPQKNKHTPISILVWAKNQQENLKKLIPLLTQQDYPNFEIVIIDDASYDDTRFLVEEFQEQHPNIKLILVENNEAFWGNKKFALTLGIKAATHEYLLFTHANCFPNSKQWINEMTSQFTLHKSIVLGYSTYYKHPSLLNKIIRFDNLLQATQYFAWAKTGKPYTGNGKNLAFKREEFFKTNGYINHMKIRSGEDELFLNETTTKTNTNLCFTPESFTYTYTNQKYNEWFETKRNQIANIKRFKPFDKFQIHFFKTTHILLLATAIALLSLQHQWIIVLCLLCTRYLAAWLTIGFAAKKLKENDLTLWFPLLETTHLFIQFTLHLKNTISKPTSWK